MAAWLRQQVMFQRSGYSRAISAQIGDIEQRLRTLERHLEAAGSRSAATAAQTANHVGENVASALSSIAENLRRRADEVEHRPLVTLGVAVAVGILVGLASHPRASPPRRAPVRRRH